MEYNKSTNYTIEEFKDIIEMLRSENGCPWDREQTHASIRRDLIEETYASLSEFYTVDASGNHVVDPDLTIAQLSPAVVKLYKVVNDALIQMEALANQEG